MISKVFIVLACLFSVTFGFTATIPRVSRGIRALKMSDAPKEGAEWVGAKKFSMKDRDIKSVMTSEQISKILPHRYPFLLVDRVVEFEAGKRAVGIKCVTANEPQCTWKYC
jgi:hypothetical protein